MEKKTKMGNYLIRINPQNAENLFKMEKYLVSIIMPSYNCGQYVEEAIRSVQAQTYQNWEIIFMDDCSTDDTICGLRIFIPCL